MGQLAQSLKENPLKSFPSDTEKKTKQCMAVKLRNGKELEEPKKNSNEKSNPKRERLRLKKRRGKLKLRKNELK